jgi:hypothetical protein
MCDPYTDHIIIDPFLEIFSIYDRRNYEKIPMLIKINCMKRTLINIDISV